MTSKRLARRILQKQSEWLRVALSSIGDGVVTTDAEGRVTFLNRMAETLIGWPTEQAVGRPLQEVFEVVDETTRRPEETPVSGRCGTVRLSHWRTIRSLSPGTGRSVPSTTVPHR